jgi:hypothetical protein
MDAIGSSSFANDERADRGLQLALIRAARCGPELFVRYAATNADFALVAA